MNNSLFSKYINKNTIINNLDARAKLFFSIIYLFSVFVSNKLIEFLVLVSVLFIVMYLSKIKILYLLSGFKSVIFLIFLSSFVHLIFNKTGYVLMDIFGYKLYSGAIYSMLLISIRFFLVVSITIILIMTTSSSEIMNAINVSLNFLNKFGINIDKFSLIMSITLRFIPTIGEEAQRIINAQISRGSNIKTGNIVSKVKNFMPIIIPIFISTLKRADDLATAMEVRGYSSNLKRTRYKILRYEKKDYFVYLITFVMLFFIIIF